MPWEVVSINVVTSLLLFSTVYSLDVLDLATATSGVLTFQRLEFSIKSYKTVVIIYPPRFIM